MPESLYVQMLQRDMPRYVIDSCDFGDDMCLDAAWTTNLFAGKTYSWEEKNTAGKVSISTIFYHYIGFLILSSCFPFATIGSNFILYKISADSTKMQACYLIISPRWRSSFLLNNVSRLHAPHIPHHPLSRLITFPLYLPSLLTRYSMVGLQDSRVRMLRDHPTCVRTPVVRIDGNLMPCVRAATCPSRAANGGVERRI